MDNDLLITVEIKSDENSWWLELTDTLNDKIYNHNSVASMNSEINRIYSSLPDANLEVKWLRSPYARVEHIEEVRTEVDQIQKELDENPEN